MSQKSNWIGLQKDDRVKLGQMLSNIISILQRRKNKKSFGGTFPAPYGLSINSLSSYMLIW